jgi:DNA-binding NtrC family response regulator
MSLSDEARRALGEHSWPGNVRELQNCLERAVILCDGSTIEPAHLQLEPPVRSGPTLADVVDLSGPLPEVAKRVVARAEEEAIAAALRETDGDRAAAAERLGVSLSTLSRRLRRAEDEAGPEKGD